MSEYVLAFKGSPQNEASHDVSTAIFRDGQLQFAAEEERYTRIKHDSAFPEGSISDCLDHCDIAITDIDTLAIPFKPINYIKSAHTDAKNIVFDNTSILKKCFRAYNYTTRNVETIFGARRHIESVVRKYFGYCPEISFVSHHESHAVSAFYPSGFDEALVVVMDAVGESESTSIWKATNDSLEAIDRYDKNNSLGVFYSTVTEFLGFRKNNGEGKIMGLAPYGEPNQQIESALGPLVQGGVEYDVSSLMNEDLGDILGWQASDGTDEFTQREKDLAYFAQEFLENTATDIVSHYIGNTGIDNVCLAGGVVMNCKMNKEIVELPAVDEYFIQPIANDAGVSLGAGWASSSISPADIAEWEDVYFGKEYSNSYIESVLNESKVEYFEPDDVIEYTATRLADGELIGWFQGRMELGARALGNRSILADPRTETSRDNVNKHVKHREEWRPFAPSMLPEGAERYLVGERDSPFMIDTFETNPETADEISGVVHPGDQTTRPQIVTERRNKKYYSLISAFAERTDVPVLLNTSFNDHGEPIVRTPQHAIRSFFTMGLDKLIVGDYVVAKGNA